MRFFVDKLVPKGYKPLTYLESSKAQYIDTGFIPDQDTRVVSVHEYVKDPANFGYIFGAGYSATDRAFEFYTWSENWNSPYNNTNISITKPSSTFVVNNKITVDKNKNVTTITYFDGSTQTNSTDYADFTVTDRSLWLFAINRDSTAEMYKSDGVRLYSCKIWNKDILIRDFQPALRESDNKPGMYDRVNNVFYTNAGTGEFLYEEPAEESIKYITNPNYQQLEYLQSTYVSEIITWIDTGYYPNNNTKVELKVSGISANTFSPSSGGTWFLGGREAYLKKMFGSYYNPSNQKLYFGFNSVMNEAGYSTSNLYGDNKVFVLDKTGLYINGTKVVNNTDTGEFTSPATLVLFGLNTNGTAVSPTIDQIQYCKIWDNGVLVRDFIPAIRKSDNKPGMYDKVTGQFFTNAGTGEFLYGSLVGPLPAKYKELEYIESTGTQYVDTGVNTDSDLGFDVGFKWDTFNTANSRFLGVIKQDGSSYQRHHSSDSNAAFAYFVSNIGTMIQSTVTTDFHDFKYDSVSKKFNFDGTEISAESPAVFDTGLDFWLFGRNSNSGSLKSYASVKIYSARLYNSDTLVRDFVPCYKVSNGEAGLYDRVTGAFFANAGTGSFIKGEKGTTFRNEIVRLVRSINNTAKTIDGYRRIDYLESTGTQYIDTEYNPNNNTRVKVKFKMNETTSGFRWLFSARSQNVAGDGFGFGSDGSGNITSDYNNRVSATVKLTDNTEYIIDKNKNICKYNNSTLTNAISTFTHSYPLYIFAMNNAGTLPSGAIPRANCYYFKIYDNNILVRDFYPVLDENDVPCMYDTVTKKLYKNKGTGTFGYGKVLPSNGTRIIRDLSDYSKEYTPLKYIQSTGTQYIDTGYSIAVNDNLDAQYDMIVTSIPNSRGLNGYSLSQAGFWGKTASDTYELGSNNTGITIGNRDKIGFIREIITETRQDTDLYINGTVVSHAQRSTTAETGPFQIFACNGGYKMSGKLYGATLKINGTLIRNFIPMLRKADNKPGLYDTVNKVFYTNAGTGEFLYETA